jgi:hypothetical protein
LWLWLESQRLNTPFSSIQDYVEDSSPKCPETRAARNGLVNVKTFGVVQALKNRPHRHPRERALRALSLLLWEPDALASAYWRERLQTELNTDAIDFPGMVAAYRALWSRVN